MLLLLLRRRRRSHQRTPRRHSRRDHLPPPHQGCRPHAGPRLPVAPPVALRASQPRRRRPPRRGRDLLRRPYLAGPCRTQLLLCPSAVGSWICSPALDGLRELPHAFTPSTARSTGRRAELRRPRPRPARRPSKPPPELPPPHPDLLVPPSTPRRPGPRAGTGAHSRRRAGLQPAAALRPQRSAPPRSPSSGPQWSRAAGTGRRRQVAAAASRADIAASLSRLLCCNGGPSANLYAPLFACSLILR